MATVTRGAWAKRLLDGRKLPLSTHRKFALVSWETAEGTNARFNPLATTKIMPSSFDYNSSHVKNYPDLKTGVEATWLTLEEKGHGYEAIIAAIQKNESAQEILEAVANSAWGTGWLALQVLPYVKENYTRYAEKPIGQ